MTVSTALAQGTQLLNDGEVAVPRLTAEVLLGHAMRVDRVYLFDVFSLPVRLRVELPASRP